MISLNIEKTFGFISKEKVSAYEAEVKAAQEMLEKGTGKGNDFLGWLHLPSSISKEHLADLNATAKALRDNCEVVIIAGIGGSYLGARAVIEALSNSFTWLQEKKTAPIMIYAGHNISEDYLFELTEYLKDKIGALDKKNKKPQNYLNGERLYDNQDVCLLLNISKRTLQRYRDNGLKYYTILHKTYYREKDLHEFIRRYFDGENVEKGKTKECNGDERIEGGMLSDDKDEPMEEDKPVDEGKLTEDA